MCHAQNDDNTAFTLIEMLVVIAILAILAALLVPSLRTARGRALETYCSSNLHQWGVNFELYHQDHDDEFERADWSTLEYYWPNTLRDYYDEDRILICPVAPTKRPPGFSLPGPPRRGSTFHAWNMETGGFGPLANYLSSYGKNGWAANPRGTWYYGADIIQNAWNHTYQVERPALVPMLADSAWVHTLPLHSDPPPLFFDHVEPSGFGQNMKFHCMDRHNGAINMLFLDGHARRTGLKEIWTLKWHPTFNTENRWTRAGGVSPGDWPKWMKQYEDF